MEQGPNRFRRLSLGIAVLLLIAALSLVALNDSFFRQKLIDAVDKSTNYQVKINGTFNTRLSLTPRFQATQIELHSEDNAQAFAINQLAVSAPLFSLLFGDPVISALTIDGMEIDLSTDQDPDKPSTGEILSGILSDTRLPRIRRLGLHNIQLRFTQDVALTLADWTMQEIPGSRQVSLEGSGRLTGKDYRISGTLGSLAALAQPAEPYPLNLKLQHREASISLSGSILEPLQAGNLQLLTEVHAADMSAAVTDLVTGIPPLGRLDAKGTLSGSLHTPSLDDLTIDLYKEPTLSLRISGSISDLGAIEDNHFRFNATTHDPQVLRWMLPDRLYGMQQWRLNGSLVTTKAGLKLQDLDATAVDPRGLTLYINGHGQLNDLTQPHPFSSIDMHASFTASNTAAARALFGENLPDMPPVQGSLRIRQVDKQTLSFEDIEITAGSKSTALLRAVGRVGSISLHPDNAYSGMDLQMEGSARHSHQLAKLLGTQLPAIEPVQISGHFSGSGLRSSMHNISLRAGKSGQLALRVTGALEFNDLSSKSLVKNSQLLVDFNAPGTKSIASFIGKELAELGPVKGHFKLQGNPLKLQAKDIQLQAGQANKVLIKASGDIHKIHIQPGLSATNIQLQVTARAAGTDKLSTLLGKDLPDLGLWQMDARLTDKDGRLGMQGAHITIGPPGSPVIAASGNIDDIYRGRDISWKIRLDIDTNKTLSAWLGRPLPDLGKLHGNMELSDSDGTLGIEKVSISSEQKDLLRIKMDGVLDDLKKTDKLDMQAQVSTANLKIIGLLLDQDWPDSNPVNLAGRLTTDKQKGAFDGTLDIGKTHFKATVSAVRKKTRPVFQGRIQTDTLYLADLGLTSPLALPAEASVVNNNTEASATSPAEQPFFSHDPLSLDWLRKLDLDLLLKAGNVVGTGARLESFAIPLQITDGGLLRVDAATFNYEQGNLLIDLSIDNRSKPARAVFRTTADDISVGRTLAHIGSSAPVDGSLNINVDLSSQGHSPAEMAANLGGMIELGMEHITLPRTLVQLLAEDLLGWTVSKTLGKGSAAKLNCGIARLKAEDGQLVSQILFFDGPNLTLSGEGSLNLAAESIDLSLYPKKKRRFWSKLTPVKISGPLSAPSVKPIPGVADTARYGAMLAAPQVVLPIAALGHLNDLFSRDDSKGANSACLEYVENTQ